MNTHCIRIRLLPALAVAAGLGLSACSEHTAPRVPALTPAQADSLAEVVVADAQGELDAATASGATGFVPGAPSGGPQLNPPVSCVPAIAPVSPANSDADRVPDSVRITFANCIFTLPRGSDTVRGTIDIIDPTPTATDHALKQVFTDFARIAADRLGRLSSITVNGARQVLRDSSQLSQSETGFRTDYVYRDGTMASHVRDWAASFRADVVGSIRPDGPLPSGTLSVTGASTWTHGGNSVALQVSTPTALHFDASCTNRPRFDAGTFIAVATRSGATTTVTIQFTACGQFTVTRS